MSSQPRHNNYQGQGKGQHKANKVIPRQVLVELDPHKMSLEPLNLSVGLGLGAGGVSVTDGNWNGGGGGIQQQQQQNYRNLLGSNLQYQRMSNPGSQEFLGPITLFKETMMTFGSEFMTGGGGGGVSVKPAGIRPPFYFMANGNNNKGLGGPKVKDSSKNKSYKRSWKKADQGIGSDLMNDLPTADSFTTLFGQFRSEEERYSELKDQLKIMVASAKEDAMKPEFPLRTYQVLQGAQVAEIFYWCKILKVTTETFFRTLELFDRFVVHFNDEIRPTLKELNPDEKAACMSRIVIQKPLRICSCIMLASKLHSNLEYPAIGLEIIRSVLEKEAQQFSLKAVAESETRVLRVLNYRTHWITPYDLTEQLISSLELPLDALPEFFSIAMLYLKYSYMRHKELYLKIKDLIAIQKIPTTKFKRTIEYNSPLRAASVVAAAAFHTYSEEFQKLCIKKLSVLISEPGHRIDTICQLLLDLVRQTHTRNNIPTINLD